MDPGKLDRWVTIQRATVTQDPGSGENVETWGTFATLRAAYKPVSDGEKFSAGEVTATLSARFTVRWSTAWDDISSLDRLTFEGRNFDIVGAKEVEAEGRRRFIEITTSARSE